VTIAVVGAHLSGLPLNCELLELGATFVRAVATKPSYRLFELPGGEPCRPGLLRTGDGEGFGIAVEVWRLSAEAFGRFVAAIPPPLGIGTLLLEDDTEVKGFLAEAAGVAGARDISEFGGWRAFVGRARSVA
jgi:allophanate hydrolase